MNTYDFGSCSTLSTQRCEGPHHFSSTGTQTVLLSGTWLNSRWKQLNMIPLTSLVSHYDFHGYVNYTGVKHTGFEEWFYCALLQRYLFYQKREEFVGWVFQIQLSACHQYTLKESCELKFLSFSPLTSSFWFFFFLTKKVVKYTFVEVVWVGFLLYRFLVCVVFSIIFDYLFWHDRDFL